MSSAADRRERGRRNVVVDLLGLGHPAPIVDLSILLVPGRLGPGDPVMPAATSPVMVPFGGAATIVVEDAEPDVTYRVRANGSGTSLSKRPVREAGRGGRLDLIVPRIDETTTFSVEATTRHGRTAMLIATHEVKIGLDTSMTASIAGFATVPVLIDHGAAVTVALARSQEAVSYSLVSYSPADAARDGGPQDVAGDEVPEGRMGDGGVVELVSGPLADDVVLRVRADRSYGKGQRQAALLDVWLLVHVRADPARPVTIAPAVTEHLGTARVTVAEAQVGVRYELVIGALADADIARVGAPGSAAVAVDADGTPLHVAVPVLGAQWRPLPGHAETDAAGEGHGRDLAIPTPPLVADSTIVVRAVKRHASGDAVFVSAVPLATPAVALVRPSAEPDLRIEAAIEGGKLVGLGLHGGQPGVFYALSAEREPLGELYVHQLDPVDAGLNKGIGRIAVDADLVVAADLATAAPPPVPRVDLDHALPLTIAIAARRATTGLRRALTAAVPIARAPTITVPIAGEAGAIVTVTPASQDRRYRLIVDGVPVGEPAAGSARSIALSTGALGVGATVVLAVDDPAVDGCAVTRRIAVRLRVG